ncbi:uncharacterized protein [Magallana gigas]|uniref:uncharacterized protein n=1 Tax=Magallana gigas TaxID=29159 RepID=UPI00333F607A
MACLRILLTSLVICGIPAIVLCDECCKAHNGLFLKNNEKWCSNYCCFKLGKFDCCDNYLLQAPSSEREDFCSDYYRSHEWVPVLIALGSLALLVGLCVFIHKACCGRSQSVGVVLQGPNPGVTVVHSGNTMQQQPGYPSNTMQQSGYPMQQAPNYPA